MQIPPWKPLLSIPARGLKLVSDLGAAVRLYGTDWITLLRRLARLRSRGGFRPREALQDGLLDPRLSESALAATISKAALVRLQKRVNPDRLDCLTEDKAIFYAYCQGLGLPVPRLLGVAARPAGFTADGAPLRGPEDWRAFLAKLPAEFVVKPSRGVYGWGVEIFRREGADFIGSTSGRHSEASVSAAFFTDPRYPAFVIQERLRAHPAMVGLSGTPYLQTVRIVTDVDGQGTCRILFAVLRVIAFDATVDNYSGGANGNLLSYIDVADGTLVHTVGMRPDGIGTQEVPLHPRTHVAFRGFRLPHWEAACALVRRAALLFLPMRTLGWDIALTPSGPWIVEVNKRWDPSNEIAWTSQRPGMTEGLVALLADLRKG